MNGCDCSQRVYFGSSYYSDFLWKSPSLNYLVVIVYLSNRHFMLFLHRKGQWVVFWLGSVFWLSDLYVNDLWQQLLYARSLLVDWGSQWALKTSPKWKKFVGWWGTYWALVEWSMSSRRSSRSQEVCWQIMSSTSSAKSSQLQPIWWSIREWELPTARRSLGIQWPLIFGWVVPEILLRSFLDLHVVSPKSTSTPFKISLHQVTDPSLQLWLT